MRELFAVALSEDGSSVVLATSPDARDGRFRVVVDERLQAAVRGDLQRAQDREPQPESTVTPREIQARLRTGESLEQIAADAGVDVSRVERFSGPVLSERTQMIDSARAATLVRGRRGPSAVPLGVAVDEQLAAVLGLRPDSVAWSTVRQEDGAWLVEVTYVVRGRHKTYRWRYDPHSRGVVAQNPSSADLGHLDAVPARPAVKPPAAVVVDPGPDLVALGRGGGVRPASRRAPPKPSAKGAAARTPSTAVRAAAGAKAVAPKVVAPKAVAPKAVAPKAVAPKAVTRKSSSPKAVARKAVAPRAAASVATAARAPGRKPAKTSVPKRTVAQTPTEARRSGGTTDAGKTVTAASPRSTALRVVPDVRNGGEPAAADVGPSLDLGGTALPTTREPRSSKRPEPSGPVAAPKRRPSAGSVGTQEAPVGPASSEEPSDNADRDDASPSDPVPAALSREDPGPGSPDVLVRRRAPRQIARPSRTGKRASVPAWADVLLSASSHDDEAPEDDTAGRESGARGRDGSAG